METGLCHWPGWCWHLALAELFSRRWAAQTEGNTTSAGRFGEMCGSQLAGSKDGCASLSLEEMSGGLPSPVRHRLRLPEAGRWGGGMPSLPGCTQGLTVSRPQWGLIHSPGTKPIRDAVGGTICKRYSGCGFVRWEGTRRCSGGLPLSFPGHSSRWRRAQSRGSWHWSALGEAFIPPLLLSPGKQVKRTQRGFHSISTGFCIRRHALSFLPLRHRWQLNSSHQLSQSQRQMPAAAKGTCWWPELPGPFRAAQHVKRPLKKLPGQDNSTGEFYI